MSQAAVGRYCSGCVTKTLASGNCANSACRWNEAKEQEAQQHLRRHYVLQGRYYIGRVLGQGGFGVTYIARDLKLDRAVAIKEFLPTSQCSRSVNRATVHSLGGDKSAQFRFGLERFLNEAQNIAKLGGHPNIVSITDHIEANGTAYMVMEFIEGVTLKQHIANQGGKISPESAKTILLHAMSGLKKVHEQRLLHRDISPDNIMISNQGVVKLIDFGAARQLLGEASQNLSVILKHGYAPPEQYFSKGHQGPWTDVYATSATLYQAVTGHRPPPALDRQSGGEVLDRPAKYCPQVPPAIESAIMKGLALKAADRYQSIGELQTAMLATNGPVPNGVRPTPKVTPVQQLRPQPTPTPVAVGPVYPPLTPGPSVYPPTPGPRLAPQLLLPPSMHWFAVMAIGYATLGVFLIAWMFVQASFVRKIDPASKARRLFGLGLVFSLLAASILIIALVWDSVQPGSVSESLGGTVVLGSLLISLFGTLFFYLGVFNMRQSLVDYYNSVEPIGLWLSGAMTFFFTVFYLQYHLSRIAMYKRTGYLPT